MRRYSAAGHDEHAGDESLFAAHGVDSDGDGLFDDSLGCGR
ncbi:MAG TPA: hypothetical protein VLA05_12245 [Coriobacteriia bacterium]|nr:hypothetical protein [Coriobacteriia bacterium]